MKTLIGHSNPVFMVTPLTNQRFASCSWDNTIKIWNDDNEIYKQSSTLTDYNRVYSILQLQQKETLVSSSCDWEGNQPALSFWSLSTYKRKFTLRGFCVFYPSHMIEIAYEKLALSTTCKEGYPIVIIDTKNYSVIREIRIEKYLMCNSSICVFDDFSFVYVNKNNFLQISIEDYNVIYKSNNEKGFDGSSGIISIDNGKYLAIVNAVNGISIVKPRFN